MSNNNRFCNNTNHCIYQSQCNICNPCTYCCEDSLKTIPDITGSNEQITVEIPDLNDILMNVILNSPEYNEVDSQYPFLVSDSLQYNNNGWDTIFAIRVPFLNQAIIKSKTSPKNFDINLSEDELIYSIQNGLFGDWQITMGGDGKNVNLNIPINQGTYKSPSGQTTNIANSIITAQIKLSYIYNDNPMNFSAMPTGKYDLKTLINHNLTNCFQLDSSKAVFITATNYPDGISETNQYVITGLLDQWLNSNLDKFNQVFATVYLEKLSQAEDFKWLKPTFMSYAYLDGPTLSDSVFAVLCMTNDHSAIGLSQQLNSIMLKETDTSAFIVNTDLYMEECLLPKFSELYKSQNVSFTKENRVIHAENFKMDAVRVGLIDYTPKVLDFRIEFNQSDIQITQKTTVNISAGIDAYISTNMKQLICLDKNEKGEPIMSYKNVGNPIVSTEIKVNPGIIITQIILSLIISVCSVIIGKIQDVTKRIVIAIITTLIASTITGITILVTNIIANGIAHSMPSVLPMINSGTRNIVWPLSNAADPDRYILKDIAYRNEIIFTGDPGIIQS